MNKTYIRNVQAFFHLFKFFIFYFYIGVLYMGKTFFIRSSSDCRLYETTIKHLPELTELFYLKLLAVRL